MTEWVNRNKGLSLLTVCLFLLALIFPVYFMADDWEHLNWFHQDYPPFNLLREFYRVPTWVVLHGAFFTVFAAGFMFLGKFLTWLSLLLAVHFALDIFSKDYRENFKSEYKYAFLTLFAAFPINLYEWSFWPTNMCVMPALLFIVLGFKFQIENPKSKLLYLLKILAYTAAFFAYESLLLLAVLVDVAYVVYISHAESKFSEVFLEGIKRTLPFFVFALIVKYLLDLIEPFPYGAEIGFKPHLFYQWLSLSFSHDYYKVRHATGSLYTVSILLMIINRFLKARKDFVKKDLFIFLMYFMSSCYYFIIMDYSARRALGGQIYFFWALLTLLALWNFKTSTSFKSLGRISASLFLFSSLIHQVYVVSQKTIEYSTIKTNSRELKNLVTGHIGEPISISMDQPRKNLGRAWNFIGVRQLNGYIRTYVPKKDWVKIKFGWDGFLKGPYSTEPPEYPKVYR